MGTPYLAEIRLVSFAFAPRGWAMCDGQTLAINQNQALFSLLGTTYGGNGQTNFQLPNAQGRVLAHLGGSFVQGEVIGEVTHTLSQQELPAHNHTYGIGEAATTTDPTGAYLGSPKLNPRIASLYSTSKSAVEAPGVITATGGGQPHPNQQPYLVMNYIIALQGIFPSRP